MQLTVKKIFKFIFWITFWTIFVTIFYTQIFFKPSLTRTWTSDQQIVATSTVKASGDIVINSVRNIDYKSTSDYTVRYYDTKLNIKDIVRAWFIVEPFGSFGAAHTFVSFELKNGKFIAISAEIRKEEGEKFSPIHGLLNQYELVYVIADENDVLKLRTNYRKDNVYLYPIKSSPEKIQQVFLSMLERANELATKPEFYNTLTNNCTTNIASHARKFSDKDIPWWDIRYLFPSTVDSLAYSVGLIDTELPLLDARKKFLITEIAQKNDDNKDFSNKIRETLSFNDQ